jgi:2,4-dienoyl-CoA reductase-like NADH-dependent reductase (Old Yellow Enzyme family)
MLLLKNSASITDELTINNLKLRNRLVLPAITNNCASAEGHINDKLISFYKDRSETVGLVIVEAAAIRADGPLVRNSIGLWADDQIEPMAKLVKAIKSNGAAAIVQLNHSGARGLFTEGKLSKASPSGFQFSSNTKPLILTEDQIKELVKDFASAARRAIEAGFDGVEIHGAHFYLLGQFLSPYTNHRQDRYGGDTKRRAQFPVEVVKAVREEIGPDKAISFRLNAVDMVEGGATLVESAETSRLLADAGADVIDVSFSSDIIIQEKENVQYKSFSSVLSKEDPLGANTEHAAAIRKESDLPVIAVGKMWSREVIDTALGEGKADLVAIGRQMIADPLFAKKIMNDSNNDPVTSCIECLNCFKTIQRGDAMQCKLW